MSARKLMRYGAGGTDWASIAPGTFIEGGYYAGRIVIGGLTYAIIVAPKAQGENTNLACKTGDSATTGTDSLNDGWSNTLAMIAAGAASHPAAQFCRGLSINGYTDWYLPARDELEICYRYLKPLTANNTTGSIVGQPYGQNTNSVPAGAAYTATNPSQTSATLFQSGQAQAFESAGMPSLYNSSTQWSGGTGNNWRQFFASGGDQYISAVKSTTSGVRAIRRVLAG